MEGNSDNDSEDPDVLSYATICYTIKKVQKDTKIQYSMKREVQAISNAMKREVSMDMPELPEVTDLVLTSTAQSLIRCHQTLWLKHRPRILY